MDLESQLTAVLNDPQKMAQILSMAQALGLSAPDGGGNSGNDDSAEPATPEPEPQPDAAGMQAIASLLRESAGGNNRASALFQALRPLLREERRGKLDRAMRAARMAHLASLAAQRLDLGQL